MSTICHTFDVIDLFVVTCLVFVSCVIVAFFVLRFVTQNFELKCPGHNMIASHLLEERDKGELSPWCEYISVLPKQFSRVPIFWDETEKEGLKGSLALSKIERRLNVLLRDYSNLCEVCLTSYICIHKHNNINIMCG